MLINSLGLKNFKCFEELNVDFRPITLLTGANSSGKSSLINAILAVLQTEQFPFYLSPNGKYVNMGSFEELLRWKSSKKVFNINLNTIWDYENSKQSIVIGEDRIYVKTMWKKNTKNNLPVLKEVNISDVFDQSISIKHLKDNDYNINIEKIIDWKNEIREYNEYDFISLHELLNYDRWNGIEQELISVDKYHQKNIADSFNYIGAFREAPDRTYYQKPKSEKVSTDGVGYIDQIIEWEETDTNNFNNLVRILQDMELINDIKTNKLKGGRFEVKVTVKEKSYPASLNDVGFGISQFLPIIVADLQLSNYSCLAVSQPEIHLHPRIQATFGNYLAEQVNNTGKQYIIETHSEYLLNRIRLLLVMGELKPEQVRVLYFENDGVKSTVHDVEFATDGQVKGAPQGFFDTYGIDVMNIAMEAMQ